MKALTGHDVSGQINDTLKNVIDKFDFEKEINPIAEEVLRDSIKKYFSYGGGRVLIESALNEALEKAFSEKEVQEIGS